MQLNNERGGMKEAAMTRKIDVMEGGRAMEGRGSEGWR